MQIPFISFRISAIAMWMSASRRLPKACATYVNAIANRITYGLPTVVHLNGSQISEWGEPFGLRNRSN
jgi:hypothetical protein